MQQNKQEGSYRWSIPTGVKQDKLGIWEIHFNTHTSPNIPSNKISDKESVTFLHFPFYGIHNPLLERAMVALIELQVISPEDCLSLLDTNYQQPILRRARQGQVQTLTPLTDIFTNSLENISAHDLYSFQIGGILTATALETISKDFLKVTLFGFLDKTISQSDSAQGIRTIEAFSKYYQTARKKILSKSLQIVKQLPSDKLDAIIMEDLEKKLHTEARSPDDKTRGYRQFEETLLNFISEYCKLYPNTSLNKGITLDSQGKIILKKEVENQLWGSYSHEIYSGINFIRSAVPLENQGCPINQHVLENDIDHVDLQNSNRIKLYPTIRRMTDDGNSTIVSDRTPFASDSLQGKLKGSSETLVINPIGMCVFFSTGWKEMSQPHN